MDIVRIGCVKYLNTLPLIEGLAAWMGCELVTSAPSGLIGMLRRGEVDVALCSVIDGVGEDCEAGGCEVGGEAPAEDTLGTSVPPKTPEHTLGTSVPPKPPMRTLGTSVAPGDMGGTPVPRGGGVVLLPVGMIGCEGRTLTVRVFSRVPLEKIERVAVDADSHTSVMLLRVLMWKKYGKMVGVRVMDEERHRGTEASRHQGGRGQNEEAMLLIGDKVVTEAPSEGAYPYQMDLGAAWKELTGLPFVYAVWMCRAGEEESQKVRTAAMMLERLRLHNATRMDWVVARHAEERGWERGLAAEYVGSLLKYDVGVAEREAAEKFVGWAGEVVRSAEGGVRSAGGGRRLHWHDYSAHSAL